MAAWSRPPHPILHHLASSDIDKRQGYAQRRWDLARNISSRAFIGSSNSARIYCSPQRFEHTKSRRDQIFLFPCHPKIQYGTKLGQVLTILAKGTYISNDSGTLWILRILSRWWAQVLQSIWRTNPRNCKRPLLRHSQKHKTTLTPWRTTTVSVIVCGKDERHKSRSEVQNTSILLAQTMPSEAVTLSLRTIMLHKFQMSLLLYFHSCCFPKDLWCFLNFKNVPVYIRTSRKKRGREKRMRHPLLVWFTIETFLSLSHLGLC